MRLEKVIASQDQALVWYNINLNNIDERLVCEAAQLTSLLKAKENAIICSAVHLKGVQEVFLHTLCNETVDFNRAQESYLVSNSQNPPATIGVVVQNVLFPSPRVPYT